MKYLLLCLAIAIHITAQPADERIQQKLKTIVLPQLTFTNATIEQAVEYLSVMSVRLDVAETDERHKGVNFVLFMRDAKATRISLDLRNIPLEQAVRYCAEQAGLKVKVEPAAVLLASEFINAPAAIDAGITGGDIVFPLVSFSGATLAECVEFIRVKSRELDPAKAGVNVLVRSGMTEGRVITLSLKSVRVADALRYIAELAGGKGSVDGGVFVIGPKQ